MISIVAERAPGDKQGQDIVDELISTDAQAIERGRIEIDKVYSNRIKVSGTCPLQGYMAPGSLVQVTDLEKGTYMAMLTSYSLTITRGAGNFNAVTNVVLERNEE